MPLKSGQHGKRLNSRDIFALNQLSHATNELTSLSAIIECCHEFTTDTKVPIGAILAHLVWKNGIQPQASHTVVWQIRATKRTRGRIQELVSKTIAGITGLSLSLTQPPQADRVLY